MEPRLKIDPEEIFYLLSGGIPRKEAERLIVEGFFIPSCSYPL
jgi:Fe-S cluster assembly scaffold protein SufB